MTTPKPNYNQDEVKFIGAIFGIFPKSERHKYRYHHSVSETTVEPADPWRQLRIGSRVIRAEMSRDWTHAGRIYELQVTKALGEQDWSWTVKVTNNRWPSHKPVAKGGTLESLHAWAGEKYPNADLPALLSTTEPVPIDWARVKRLERRALGLC